jgi:hypothetical protein
MKSLILFVCISALSVVACAQNGYIKFNKNQLVSGYVKVHNASQVHEHQIEISDNKDHIDPKRYHKKDIIEYAINGDTFKILKKFFPYDIEEIYYELIDAKVIQSGNVSLLQIHNSYSTLDEGLFATLHDQSPSQVPYFYVLQDSKENYTRGVPTKKEKFKQVLGEFFSDESIVAYENEHGSLHFRDLQKIVTFCNRQELD